jgi:NAD(P)-dependent dehydrogenase (short-subunit alcohol dehydrogenase family)
MPEPTRSILITGASTGIGEACALEFDRRNWRVLAGVRSEEAGRRLREQASPRLSTLHLDVTDSESLTAAIHQATEMLGNAGLDGLVNNAGIVVAGPMELIPLAELRKQFEVNVFGQVATTQAFLPLLRAARGRIVMMSSISGQVTSPYLGPYAASKHALEAVSDALRMELRRWGIGISIVEPGSVATPIWGKARGEADRMAERMTEAHTALYGEEIEQMRRSTERLAARGIPVQKVVDVVVHAMTAKRPKTRYVVGAQARLAAATFRFLADRTKDWFILRELGLRP